MSNQEITYSEGNWLDQIVARHLDLNIDRLARGREHIVSPRSRKLLHTLAHNVVLDVVAELLSELESKSDG